MAASVAVLVLLALVAIQVRRNGVHGPGSRAQDLGSRVYGPGSRLQGSGSRVQGPGFMDQGSGSGVQVQIHRKKVQGPFI